MGSCRLCHKNCLTISNVIGFCGDCIRAHFDQVWPEIKRVHARSRKPYGLPEDPPRAEDGVPCQLCFHQCSIPEGGVGFCGLRRVEGGKLKGGRPHEGNLSYYYDPLPTNCVGDFVCAAGTGCGYPKYAVTRGPEHGHNNLAVFYHACSFNCLYCQNHQFKDRTSSKHRISARKLASAVQDKTTCICYFGGDPTPQILHALKASKLAVESTSGRIMRVCWETNGAMQEPSLSRMAQLSLESGGCIKFDLKAWDLGIHHALCGVSNQQTLENFRKLSELIPSRPEPPLLIASTLLVPGYVDENEVAFIAEYLAQLNPEIPYSLLAFYPHFYLYDLPTTSRNHALRCKEVAKRAGLKHVHLGNLHLLGSKY
ncbi:MAG: radical SAM protein [Deltaproteobacteria bacterium]|nr:MAG: radical SAM protein [Deltaproteobacteria bacterium]